MKLFRDIKGQDRAITLLKRAYRNSVITHAYLFLGPPGVGKSLVAKNFIKLINCISVTTDTNPCNQCVICKKIESNSFLDLIHIKPESSKDVIKIDQIREIEEKISYKKFEGKEKIVFIEDIEQMNNSSFNALLKTLEEPPEGTIFILTASNEESIPKTITSRCQTVLFNPLREDIIYSHLIENYSDEDSDKLLLVSKLSQGSMTRAKEWLELNILERRWELFNDLIVISDFKFPKVIARVEKIVSELKGDKFYIIGVLLDSLKTFLRDSYLYSIGLKQQDYLINIDFFSDIERIGSKVKPEIFLKWENRLSKLTLDIQSNVNTETSLNSFFIDFLLEFS
ncbi:DNA polymerase III subunit delta' [bacterium]|nr:DNA polymerase III subunit delta' [bacterium]